MDEPVSQQEASEDPAATTAGVWAQLDPSTRARVLELFAISAYNFVIAHRRAAVEEDCDVYSGRNTEDHDGAH